MKNNFFKPVLIGIIFIFILLFFGNQTKAGIGLSIQPIKVHHTINSGESTNGVISLTNVSDEAVKIETILRDFVPMAGTISIQFVGRAEGATTVVDWISLDHKEPFILEKGKAKEIQYTIRAPANAEPGGHFGTIFFKANSLKEKETLKIGTQVGALVFVIVPGPNIQKGKILDFSAAKFFSGTTKPLDILKRKPATVNFKIKFENTGTIHFEPKGTIKITNMFGKEVAEVAVAGQVVLPTGARDLSNEWPVRFLLGYYKAKASVFDGEGNELTTKTISFFAFPVGYAITFVIILLILFFGLKFLKRKIKISVSLKG